MKQISKEISELRAYPNPTLNNLTIEGSAADLAELNILNKHGLDASTSIRITDSSPGKLIIDVSELPSGNYYVKTPTTLVKLSKL
ncbi:MAG: hypothetical protein HRT57_02935 [Crocinitomicaceae bacterium]|nr:hypothetical protein [Crocinitomicaceae bacterium]